MPDTYATIADADEDLQVRLADVLDLRAADPQQRAMLQDYLADLPLSGPARVLEIGSGTGCVTQALAERPGVTEAVGIDPSPVFVERARTRFEGDERLSFVVGDGRELPFEAGSFDAVVCHTTLCHIPGPERVLTEAARAVSAGGWLAVFDGDYATTTVATGRADPLQACIDAVIETLVHDPFLVRRLTRLAEEAGWSVLRLGSHGYVETSEPHYMLTLVDRGAEALVAGGIVGAAAAEALKSEARRRASEGTFFGHIAYGSLIARRRT
jgi:ubiquinone/menaquinone biosynthesis C-methylase UbiE